jgi:UDP-glucose 4-epimerase
MKLVVTGALGHIGSRLIRELPRVFSEMEIVLLDNLSTQRYCSLFNLPADGHYHFMEADVLDADLVSVFTGAQAVVHLAAITNAVGSFENQEQVEQVNFIGTQKVAQACLITGSALIFPSTTSVYGTQDGVVDEECLTSDLKPQSPYAESKLKAEQCLQELGKSEGLRFVACRFGTIFGTSIGMRFHTAVNKFCWQAVNGLPLTVWRTAMDQQRPYLDLADAVESIKFILQNDLFDRNIYNVLTLNASVRQIVEVIAKYVPDTAVQYVDTPIMNQLSYHVLNERFKRLGFGFKGDLESGIADTLQLLKGLKR